MILPLAFEVFNRRNPHSKASLGSFDQSQPPLREISYVAAKSLLIFRSRRISLTGL